jgi:hypothetical protein
MVDQWQARAWRMLAELEGGGQDGSSELLAQIEAEYAGGE